ncbi:MAG: hypothetical protein K2X93_05770, partial [Candidatus Obscuribacterales bacterium]|nr:hypothetical protein [Candidatus Obscuribacterales bacterium]
YESVDLLLKDLEKIKGGQELSITTAVHDETPSHSRGEILIACGELLYCGFVGFMLAICGAMVSAPITIVYIWWTIRSWLMSKKCEQNKWSRTLLLSRLWFVGSISLFQICYYSGILEVFPQQVSYLIPVSLFISMATLGVVIAANIGNLIFGKRSDQTARKVTIRMAILALPLVVWAYFLTPTSLSMIAMLSSVGRSNDASASLEKTPKALIAIMKTALAIDPQSTRYEELIRLLNETGQHEQAIDCLTDAFSRLEFKRELLRLRALTYAEMGRLEPALEDIRRAETVKLAPPSYINPLQPNYDPSENKLLCAKGDVLLRNKKFADAITAYSECLTDAREGSNPLAIEHRAIARQIVGDKKGALADMDQLVQHFRSSKKVNYYLMRARMYELNNEPAAALADYKRAAGVLQQGEKFYSQEENVALLYAGNLMSPVRVSGSYLERAYVYNKIGETKKSEKYLQLAEASGQSKEDLLREFNDLLGSKLDW